MSAAFERKKPHASSYALEGRQATMSSSSSARQVPEPPVEQEKKIKQKKERDLVRVLQIINQKGNLVKERVLVRLAVKDEIREKASGQRVFQHECLGHADGASHHRRHLRQYADA